MRQWSRSDCESIWGQSPKHLLVSLTMIVIASRAKRIMLGFTLIELMVVIAIAAILTAIAVPGFQGLIASQKIKNTAYELVSDLTLARIEALTRGRCVRIASAAGGWAMGWTVRTYQPVPPTPTGPCPNVADVEISQKSEIGGSVSLTQALTSITFDANGRLTGTSSIVRFALSDGGTNNRCISLDPSGRPKSVKISCPI